jgi:alkaline phosphatase D
MTTSSRREFLATLSALGIGARSPSAFAGLARAAWRADPFTLGVASGDPTADGVVLWTRLAPDTPGAGENPRQAIAVCWEVAEDEQLRRIVRRGEQLATPEFAHSVHVELAGLNPDRWYWYRFMSGDAVSGTGRTRTMPAPGTMPARLRLGVASCQHYEQGFYAAHEHLAREELDLVAFLGDYIYEGTTPDRPRQHGAGEPRTLGEYRERYALYKRDAQLRRAHAACPWIVTWDDHEVDNNYAAAVPQDNEPIGTFALRRAAAYRAYYEHMPLRRASMPRGPEMLLYRTLSFGDLASFQVLDTRQYRDDQACGDGNKPPCAEWSRADRSLLGRRQERWVEARLGASTSRWNVLAQQVQMAPMDQDPSPGGERYGMESWSGYPAARDRLLSFVASRKVRNVITLTGDVHASYASEIPRDYRVPGSPRVAVEYVCSSMSSGGDGVDAYTSVVAAMTGNPWMKYHNARRGYIRCEITPDAWLSEFRLLPHVRTVDAPISTAASFVTPGGVSRVERS